jgi:hypothetical protein
LTRKPLGRRKVASSSRSVLGRTDLR